MFSVQNKENCQIGDEGCFHLGKLKAWDLERLSLGTSDIVEMKTGTGKRDARAYREETGSKYSGVPW